MGGSRRLSVTSQGDEDPFRERDPSRRPVRVRAADGDEGEQEIAVPEGQVEREKESLQELDDESLFEEFRTSIWLTSKAENGFLSMTLWKCTTRRLQL